MAKTGERLVLAKRIQLMMGLISLQFVLGMGLNTIGQPDKGATGILPVVWIILLVLHIINASVMLGIASYIVYYCFNNRNHLDKSAIVSTAAIVLAIIFGLLTLSHVHQELFSFFMALAFLVAISNYGSTLGKVVRH